MDGAEWEASLAQEREGLPLPDDWRVKMARRVVLAANRAVHWSGTRHLETQQSANAWLRDAKEDLTLAQRSAPPKASVKPSALDRRTQLWIDHWRRVHTSRREHRLRLEQSFVWRREMRHG